MTVEISIHKGRLWMTTIVISLYLGFSSLHRARYFHFFYLPHFQNCAFFFKICFYRKLSYNSLSQSSGSFLLAPDPQAMGLSWPATSDKLRPEQNGHHLQVTFRNTFSLMKNIAFWLNVEWSLVLMVYLLRQKILIFALIHENTEGFCTCFHLIQMIFSHCARQL